MRKFLYQWWAIISGRFDRRMLASIVEENKQAAPDDAIDKQAVLDTLLECDNRSIWPLRWVYRYLLSASRRRRAEHTLEVILWLRRHPELQIDNCNLSEPHTFTEVLGKLWRMPLSSLLKRIHNTMHLCSAQPVESEKFEPFNLIDKVELLHFGPIFDKDTEIFVALNKQQVILGSLLENRAAISVDAPDILEILNNTLFNLSEANCVDVAIKILQAASPSSSQVSENVLLIDRVYGVIVKSMIELMIKHAEHGLSIYVVERCLEWCANSQKLSVTGLTFDQDLHSLVQPFQVVLEYALLVELPNTLQNTTQTDDPHRKVIGWMCVITQNPDQYQALLDLHVQLVQLNAQRIALLSEPFNDISSGYEKHTLIFIDAMNNWLKSLSNCSKAITAFPEVEALTRAMLERWYVSVTDQLIARIQAWRDGLLQYHVQQNESWRKLIHHKVPSLVMLLDGGFCVEYNNSFGSKKTSELVPPNRYVITRQYPWRDFQVSFFASKDSTGVLLSHDESLGVVAAINSILDQPAESADDKSKKLLSAAQEELKPYHDAKVAYTNWLYKNDVFIIPPVDITLDNCGRNYRKLIAFLSYVTLQKIKEKSGISSKLSREVDELAVRFDSIPDEPEEIILEYNNLYSQYEDVINARNVDMAHEIKLKLIDELAAVERIVNFYQDALRLEPELGELEAKIQENSNEFQKIPGICMRRAMLHLHPDRAVFKPLAESVFIQISNLVKQEDFIERNPSGRLLQRLNETRKSLERLKCSIHIKNCIINFSNTYSREVAIEYLKDIARGTCHTMKHIESVDHKKQAESIRRKRNHVKLTFREFANYSMAEQEGQGFDESYREAMITILNVLHDRNPDELKVFRQIPGFEQRCDEACRLLRLGIIQVDASVAKAVSSFPSMNPHQMIVWTDPRLLFGALHSRVLSSSDATAPQPAQRDVLMA